MAEEVKTNETTAAEAPKAEAPKEPAENPEVVKLKNALSRANSEAASWKKKYNDTLDEQQRAALKAEEERAAELAELETLRKEKRISTYKARLMESGIDHATADVMANSLPDGATDELFGALKNYISTMRQAVDTAALNNQPGLSVGLPPSGVQKSELDKKLDQIFKL